MSTRKVKPVWILMKQEMMRWQWHQLDHMQLICASVQTDNHASTSSLSFFTYWMLFLMPSQQCQSTEGSALIEVKSVCICFLVCLWCLQSVFVSRVTPEGAAERAGLRLGDKLVSVGV